MPELYSLKIKLDYKQRGQILVAEDQVLREGAIHRFNLMMLEVLAEMLGLHIVKAQTQQL